MSQMEDEAARTEATDGVAAPRARLLFRYLGGEEWQEYRAILAVFADTFFTEFAPEDVVDHLKASGVTIELGVVADRLESLRNWGNLTASTTVGNPASLDDYYRRRHRYLITRAGQEVHSMVEGVLHSVDQIGDVQAGRLRDLLRALQQLQSFVGQGLQRIAANDVIDAVRGVFDPHESFSDEITQFFASINQWQSRYDLEPEEIGFFAEVLVGYVSEQLVEIERMARPISQALRRLEPDLDAILLRAQSGLAVRVDDAGFADNFKVRAVAGTARTDWDHLRRWFEADHGAPSRLESLTRQAIAAVRTLTGNLTRLSRAGAGSASRRIDFVRLAAWLDTADTVDDAHALVSAAFGLHAARHLSLLSQDADDPVATVTPWADAPRASVPITLRERGERAQRGSASRVRDRAMERELLRRQREEERDSESRLALELLDVVDAEGRVHDVEVTTRALRRVRLLLAASGARRRPGHNVRTAQDRDLVCQVTRVKDARVRLRCPEGALTLFDAELRLHAVQRGEAMHEPHSDASMDIAASMDEHSG